MAREVKLKAWGCFEGQWEGLLMMTMCTCNTGPGRDWTVQAPVVSWQETVLYLMFCALFLTETEITKELRRKNSIRSLGDWVIKKRVTIPVTVADVYRCSHSCITFWRVIENWNHFFFFKSYWSMGRFNIVCWAFGVYFQLSLAHIICKHSTEL